MEARPDGFREPAEELERDGNPALVLRRLTSFARFFSSTVPVRHQIAAAFLILLAGLTEGIGLVLLIPLLALLNDGSTPVEAKTIWSKIFGAFGLPLSMLTVIAVFVGLVACRAVVVYFREISTTKLRLMFVEALQRRLYNALLRAEWSFVVKERLSRLLRTLNTDIEQVGHGTFFFLQLPGSIAIAVCQTAVALALAPLLTLVALVCGGLISGLVWYRRNDRFWMAQKFSATRRTMFDQLNDCLAILKLVKSRQDENRQRARFADTAAHLSNHVLAFARDIAESRLMFQIGAAIALGLFAYIATTHAQLPTAQLLIMIVIFSRVMPRLAELQQGTQGILPMLPVFQDVQKLIARAEAAAEPPTGEGVERLTLQDEIRLSNVSFRYDKRNGPDVLAGVDLNIAKGSVVAVVGMSGAGKSTLADLLIGLIVPDTGSVLVDGMPIAGPRLAAWRRSVAYVPQDNLLLNDTIRANMMWAKPDASDASLAAALSQAGADALIASLPDGQDTILGERGTRLSGGERQRVALAAALLRKPTLLVLDEATNALDNESERVLWSVIGQLRPSMTIVLIAHRLSVVRDADRIFVLKQGRLIQAGSWDSLMADRAGHFAVLAGAEYSSTILSDQAAAD